MTFMKVKFILTYKDGSKKEVEKQLLDMGDYSEVDWVAHQLWDVNKPSGCKHVAAFRDGKLVADTALQT